jgi:hypothetical protein
MHLFCFFDTSASISEVWTRFTSVGWVPCSCCAAVLLCLFMLHFNALVPVFLLRGRFLVLRSSCSSGRACPAPCTRPDSPPVPLPSPRSGGCLRAGGGPVCTSRLFPLWWTSALPMVGLCTPIATRAPTTIISKNTTLLKTSAIAIAAHRIRRRAEEVESRLQGAFDFHCKALQRSGNL